MTTMLEKQTKFTIDAYQRIAQQSQARLAQGAIKL